MKCLGLAKAVSGFVMLSHRLCFEVLHIATVATS